MLKLRNDYVLLRETIKKKDKKKAQNLIRKNVSVNIPNARGNTPLHWAIIKFDDLDIVKMLLAKGANIHVMNHRHQKPLDVAIENNKTEAALLLIKKGALVGEDFNALLFKFMTEKKYKIIEMLIHHELQNNPSIDLKVFLNAAISHGQSEIIEIILLHCNQSLKPIDKYIPRETVMKSEPQYKQCIQSLLKWNFTINPGSKYDQDFIYEAVKNGHLPVVLRLLKMGIDVNLVNVKTRLNLLKVACLHKHHDIVEHLLKHNACVNVKTPTNIKILDYFSYHSCNHSLSFIINTSDLHDITCLHIAVLNSDPLMVKILLKYGATIIDDPNFFRITCIAIQYNNEEIFRNFLDHGVNVNEIDSEGKSLLHFCVHHVCDEKDLRYNITKLLLEKGATIHFQTPGNSLVYDAIDNRHCKIAQLLLDKNADIQYTNPEGNTSLHAAIKNNFEVKFIQTLLKHHSPVNAVNDDKQTPLHIACLLNSENQLEIIKMLIEYNANVNCADVNLMTPLHFVCRYPKLEIVTVLLDNKANPNASNNIGQTPLHLACEQEYFVFLCIPITTKNAITLSIIETLLQHNANIEATDQNGWTPLFAACNSGNDTAVQCLLDNHANVNHTDLEKSTSLYIAAKNFRDNSKIMMILLKHKVNVHFIDKSGKSIIHVIAQSNAAKVMKSLSRTQINFNPIDKEGNTPLHIAVEYESVEMVRNLIKYGANVNILNKTNQTALSNAIKYMIDCQTKFVVLGIIRFWVSSEDSPQIDFHRHSCTNSINNYKEIIKILKIQIVKLKTAKLKVNNSNLKIVYKSDDMEASDDNSSDGDDSDDEDPIIDVLQLEIDCEAEIEKLKIENIGVNNMTFQDLLTINIHRLSRFVKNKKIRQTLELEVYDEKFPLYIDIIRGRFRDAKFRCRMMNSAKKYFSSNITQRLSDDCIDLVFSYLNIKDLKMFTRAFKPLN